MAEDRILEYRDDNGGIYDVPESEKDAFLKEMGDAGVRVTQPVANPKPLGRTTGIAAPAEGQPQDVPTFSGYQAPVAPFPEGDPLRADVKDAPLAQEEVQEYINDANKGIAKAAADVPDAFQQSEARRVAAMASPVDRTEETRVSPEAAAIRHGREISERGASGPLSYEEQADVKAYENYEDEQYYKQISDIAPDAQAVYDKVDRVMREAGRQGQLGAQRLRELTDEDMATYNKVKELQNNDLSKRVRQRHVNRLQSESNDIDRMLDAFQRERAHWVEPQRGSNEAGRWEYDDPRDAAYAENLREAANNLRDARDAWNAPVRGGYLKGIANKAGDFESLPFVGTIETTMKNLNERRVGDRMQEALKRGEDPASVLDDSELALMASVLDLANANQMRSHDTSALYRGGQIAFDALSFMAEFMVTNGASTATKNTIAKSIMRRLAGNGRAMGTRFARFLGESVGGPVATAVRTAMMPSTAKNYSEWLVKKDDDGSYKYTPREAFRYGLLDSYIETLSEGAGEAFGRLGLGKLVDNVLGRSKWSAAVGDLLNGTNSVLRQGGVQSLGLEWTEELYGTALRSMFPVFGPAEEQWAEFLDKDNQISMISGFALMSGVGAGSSAARRIRTKKDYDNKIEESDKEIGNALSQLEHHLNTLSTKKAHKERVADVIAHLPEMTAQEQAKAIGDIVQDAEKAYKGKATTFNGRWGNVKRAFQDYAENEAQKQTLQENYKKAVTSFDTEDHHQDYINWDRVFGMSERGYERAARPEAEQAERAPLSDYMEPIVPSDMVEAPRSQETPAAQDNVAAPTEAAAEQVEQPTEQAPEEMDDITLFRDRYGAALPETNGAYTPVKKDGAFVGYMIRKTPSGAITFLEKTVDENGDIVWKRSYGSAAQGYRIDKPVDAKTAYGAEVAPLRMAQQGLAAGQQELVDGQAATTQEVIDGAQQEVAKQVEEEQKEQPEPAPEPQPEPQPAPQEEVTPEPTPAPVQQNDDEAFLASLPKKGKTQNLDYAAFTPEQTVRYTAMQSDMATAIDDARATVAQRRQEAAELNEKIGKSVGTDRLALRAQAKEIADEIAAYEGIINEYQQAVGEEAPAEQPVAAESVEAPQPAPEPAPAPAPAPKTTAKRRSRKPAERPAEPAAPAAQAAQAEESAAPADAVQPAEQRSTEVTEKESEEVVKAERPTQRQRTEASDSSSIDQMVTDLVMAEESNRRVDQKRGETKAKAAISGLNDIPTLEAIKENIGRQLEAAKAAGVSSRGMEAAVKFLNGAIDERINILNDAGAAETSGAAEIPAAPESSPAADRRAAKPASEGTLARVTSTKGKRPALTDIDGLINYYIDKINQLNGAPLTRARNYSGKFGNALKDSYDTVVPRMLNRINEMLERKLGNADDLQMLRSSLEQSKESRRNAPHTTNRHLLPEDRKAITEEAGKANGAAETIRKILQDGIEGNDNYTELSTAIDVLKDYLQKSDKGRFGFTAGQKEDMHSRFDELLTEAAKARKAYLDNSRQRHADIVPKQESAPAVKSSEATALEDEVSALLENSQGLKSRLDALENEQKELQKEVKAEYKTNGMTDRWRELNGQLLALGPQIKEARDARDAAAREWAKAKDKLIAANKQARFQVELGSVAGRKASKKELNRLANQLIKVLPSSMRDKVKVVGHEEFAKQLAANKRAATFNNDTGQTLGFVGPDGSCYIDADNAQVKTPLHEIGIHMLMDAAKKAGEPGLRNAIIEYGKQAPQEHIDKVKANYGLEEGTDEFYEEVAAHAFGAAFEDRQAEFAQQNIFQRLLQAIKDFLDKFFNGKYANLDVFDSVEKLGEEKLGQKLYDLVMGGREIAIANQNDNSNFAILNINQDEYTDEFRRVQEESKRLLPEEISKFHRGGLPVGDKDALRRNLGRVYAGLLSRGTSGSLGGRRLTGKGNTFNLIQVNGSLFHDIFEINQKYLENGELVDLHPSSDYDKAKCFLSDDGLCGFAIEDDGNLISVFSLNPSDKKGFLYAISDFAKEQGATHLDAYASDVQNLEEIYKKVFKAQTASKMDYNMEYDHDDIAANHGGPKVVFMVFSDSPVEMKLFDKDSYDDAVEYQKKNIFIPIRRQIIGEKGARNLAEYRGDSTITDNLDTAKQMMAEGRDMLDIKRATGWEYDSGDKKWRTETADAGASSNVQALLNEVNLSKLNETFNEGDVTLDDLLEDGEPKEELFAAYPILRHWIVSPQTYSPSEGKGRTSIEGGEIVTNLVRGGNGQVRKASPKEVRGNLIHEVQHVIQSVEGFAAGAAPGKRLSEINDRIAQIDNDIDSALEMGRPIDRLVNERYRLADEAKKIVDEYESYAGEVESRNAERRADMPMDERLTSLLSSTEDVSGEKIYSFDYSGEMHSASTAANNAYNAALAALNTASGDMTAEQWRQHFKDAKVKDKDLDYFLGGRGYREDGEVISSDEIFDYLEMRYYNDNPYAAALGAYAGTITDRSGVKGFLDDAWRYLKDDIVAYGTIMRDVLRNGGTIDAESNFEHLHNTQASASGKTIARFEQGRLRDILDAEAALANKLGLGADAAREAIGRYLIALHAPERNRLLTCRKIADRVNRWAKRHGIDVTLTEEDVMPFYDGTPTQGMDRAIADRIQDILDEDFATPESRNQSGMTDDEAADVAQSFETMVSDKDAGDELDDMLGMVRLANEETAKFALDHGLITPETYNEYTTRYEHYIPLVGFEDDSDREAAMDSYGSHRADGGTGMNAAVRSEAQGRKSQSANPIAGIYLRAVNTINNGYENDSRMALHKMIMDNVPLKNLFYIEGMEKPSWAESMSGKELDRHSVFVYVNGVPTRMYFNGQQGLVLSNGLDHFTNINRKLNAAISDSPDGTIGNYAARAALWAWNATREVQAWRSQIVTTLNPIFSPVNFIRDMSFAARQIYIQQGAEAARRWFSNAWPSVQVCADYLALNTKNKQNAVLNGFDVQQEIVDAVANNAADIDTAALAQALGIDENRVKRLVTQAEFNLFVENGGMIGYTQQITEENAKRSHAHTLKRITDGKNVQNRAARIKEGVEDCAQSFENVSRFAAFKAALEGGSSPAAAAFAAHEVATNLSRRGTQSLLSGERMFFNATLESLNQAVKNYSNPETRGRQLAMSGATVAFHVLAMMAVGAWAKALFRAGGGDDDNDKHLKSIMARLPEYRKTGEMVIPYSVDEYGRVKGLRVHGAFQYRALTYATTKVMEVIAGDADAGEAFGNIIRAYWQEYSPLSGSSVDSKQDDSIRIDLVSIIPDAFKPIVEIINNENTFGSAIYNEPNEGTAAAERPDWSNARLGTDKTAIAISRFLNRVSGGSGETSKGAINIHPESIEYLFRQFTGAFGQAYSMIDNQIGMTEAERKRYGEQDPLKSRFWYNGERDLGYGLVEEYARNAPKAKGMAKLSEDINGFREIGNVPDEVRRDLNRAAQAMGYVTYNQMASAVKKMENQYRDLVRKADDPTLSDRQRSVADSSAIKLLDGIERTHYEFAVKLNKTFKKK